MMDLELRLAALSKLIDNKSATVERRLGEEFRHVESLLLNSTDYDELWGALKILAVLSPKFHGAVVPLLKNFVQTISTRVLTHGGEEIPLGLRRYRSAEQLIREAIDTANSIRYVHTEILVDFLLQLSQIPEDEVRKKAEKTLEELSDFDINVFYGESGLGAQPQARVVAYLAKLEDSQLVKNAGAICAALSNVLSPSMEGHSWTYKSVTISRGAIVSEGGISEMRANAIELLKRMYQLSDSIEYRGNVLNSINNAMRRERPTLDSNTESMFDRDALSVLRFIQGLVQTEALPLVQKIEHQAFWNYYHAASRTIELAALDVRDALAAHSEYQIYKNLIGFEAIFGSWEELRRSESAWDYSDTKRREAARLYVEEIDSITYEMWRNRILEYSKTRSSDLATFPIYYEFLESIGQQRPSLALELVISHTEIMAPFLIPLLRGLWISDQVVGIEAVVKRWIADGEFLPEIAKSLYKVGAPRIDTLYRIVARSAELENREPVLQVLGVAASLYAGGCSSAKNLFMDALRQLAKHGDTSWANIVWFSRDLRTLIGAMEVSERAEVLASLDALPQLHFQAEEVLSVLAEKDMPSVLDYFLRRLKHARAQSKKDEATLVDEERFEAIPYSLHKLNKLLAQAPEMLVLALRRDFEEEFQGFFTYRGARLIKSAFPVFGEPLESLLRNFVEKGSVGDVDFVLAILRVYEGSSAILNLCNYIVRATEEGSSTWDAIATCIKSTGVVSGEYGMVEAFDRKRAAVSLWMQDDDIKVQNFARWLISSLERLIDYEKRRADEDIQLRKYKYGVGKDEA